MDWQINEENWMSGGVTNVRFKHDRSWPTGRDEPDLKNTTQVAECGIPRPRGVRGHRARSGLSCVGLNHLRSLNLARLNHLRYGLPETALSDACLVPIQGMGQLRSLTLSGNRITDDGLALIAGLPELESLDLDATDVTDAGLIHLQTAQEAQEPVSGRNSCDAQGARRLQSALPSLEVNFDISPEVERTLKQSRREHR